MKVPQLFDISFHDRANPNQCADNNIYQRIFLVGDEGKIKYFRASVVSALICL